MRIYYDAMVVWTDDRPPGAPGRSTPQSHRLARRATRAEAEVDITQVPEAGKGVSYEIWEIKDNRWTAAEIRAWIERHGGNVTACARRLGVPRTQVQAWIAEPESLSARHLPRYVQAHMETLDQHPEDPASW